MNEPKNELNIVQNPKQSVPAPITTMGMLQIAVEQGADLAKIEKLMDLNDRYEKDIAKREYIVAMNNFRANVPEIDRTKQGHNSKYAGLAETLEAIKSVLSLHGLSHAWVPNQSEGLISVTCYVTHSKGHQECATLSAAPDDSGKKNGIQAIGSTVSYLQRYTLYAILGLASKDSDDDGVKSGTIKNNDASYSSLQKHKYYNLLKGDALEFYLNRQELGQDVAIAIASTFPDGDKSKLKAKERELIADGLEIFLQIQENIIEHIKNNDSGGVKENKEDLGITGWYLVWQNLNKEQQATVRELLL